MKDKKILYGVCGIGGGHTYRQLPIIEQLARQNTIVIFAYGVSLQCYTGHFANHPRVTVVEVAVPYYPGNAAGLDFLAAAELAAKADTDYVSVNSRAMAMAESIIGRPDLVISDYEPVCAQYAYAHDAPFVTIDQQSKYLSGMFPPEIDGLHNADETMRLRMFFPRAILRIACSFFRAPATSPDVPVTIVPSVVRQSVQHIRDRRKADPQTILVYLSSQYDTTEAIQNICAILGRFTKYTFHLFLSDSAAAAAEPEYENIHVYRHGAADFDRLLGQSAGIISTAGHGLLSEAMYLGIPVYALPLPLYEQAMNAHVLGSNNFGVSAPSITSARLQQFLERLAGFRHNIQADKQILLRTDGTQTILALLDDIVTQKGRTHA